MNERRLLSAAVLSLCSLMAEARAMEPGKISESPNVHVIGYHCNFHSNLIVAHRWIDGVPLKAAAMTEAFLGDRVSV
jgi:hypothetical protein